MKNRKMNNKGFSLVELIIVIAIMAVLVGVSAPAYLRYVEKSRKSADIQAIDSVMVAMEATAMGPEFDMKAGDKMKALFKSGKLEFSVEATKAADIKNELIAVIGAYTTRSTEFKNFTVTGTIDTDGTVDFTISTGDDGEKVLKYSDFEGRLK